MVHALADHPLPGIDARRMKRMKAAGLDSLEAVVEAGPERLAEVTGFDAKTCRALVQVAASALARHDPDVIAFEPKRDEPASERLARGLKAARRIERALSLARKARSEAGRRPERDEWVKAHRKARKQLRKLLEALQSLQQDVLSNGLSQAGYEHLKLELQQLEAGLHAALDAPADRRTFKRLARSARDTRHALRG